MATFGERFKKLRKAKNLTQKELTDYLFEKYKVIISSASISAYENDKGIPEMPLLNNIADYFNVSLDYLMGRSDVIKPVEIYNAAFHSLSTEGLTEDELTLLENMIHQFKKNRGIIK